MEGGSEGRKGVVAEGGGMDGRRERWRGGREGGREIRGIWFISSAAQQCSRVGRVLSQQFWSKRVELILVELNSCKELNSILGHGGDG